MNEELYKPPATFHMLCAFENFTGKAKQKMYCKKYTSVLLFYVKSIKTIRYSFFAVFTSTMLNIFNVISKCSSCEVQELLI